MARGAQHEKNGSRGGHGLLIAGAVLFVVAWLVPVYSGQHLFGGMPTVTHALGTPPEGVLRALDHPDWLPGLGAAQLAWHFLTAATPGEPADVDTRQRVLGATVLTNAVMVFGLLLIARRRHQAMAGVALLGCAALNAGWIYLLDEDPFELYRPGYFLWLGSFALVGTAGLARAVAARR